MVASVAFFNILAMVAFALPQTDERGYNKVTVNEQTCQTATKDSLSYVDHRFCVCVMDKEFCKGRGPSATCEVFCSDWAVAPTPTTSTVTDTEQNTSTTPSVLKIRFRGA